MTFALLSLVFLFPNFQLCFLKKSAAVCCCCGRECVFGFSVNSFGVLFLEAFERNPIRERVHLVGFFFVFGWILLSCDLAFKNQP